MTLTWWHNASTDPGKTAFQKVADDFHAAHPNVTISVQPIQNETIKTKIQVALQGTPPDIFQQWGGGAEAIQAQSGKLADLTQLTSSWIGDLGKSASGWSNDGKQLGVPLRLPRGRLLVPHRPVPEGGHQLTSGDHD